MTKLPLIAAAALIGLSSVAHAGNKHHDHYSYAVKFVCGFADSKSHHQHGTFGPVVDGRYATAINLFNPNHHKVRIEADAVSTSHHFSGSGLPTPGHFEPKDAFKIDCDDLFHYFSTGSDLLKGVVYITADKRLDVIAVYTARDDRSAGPSIDVEQVFGRKIDKHGNAGKLED